MEAQVRKFLVVVDKTPECKVAVRFAARRAQHTDGRMTLLCVAAPVDFQQWGGVEEIMTDEAHRDAEALVYDAAKIINELTGLTPELIIEHGEAAECLMELIRRDRDISILVLAAGTSKDGPGPLVKLFATKVQAIPVTIVPGNLTDTEVDELA
ncbi:universal stress protein [Rhizomicrobium electricum]|jgi:nucleotide-binding universal stress UspA family protein|uniref:Universal stress protein n=1 Tax=Rhizomicrobium electricum TaxID=480070 RepID=A0ABP3Q8D7_9PROT|nr:universal stress protein [Rhizomicrobium electricum]NIJ49308.1 nucleotide-binding universal stress UspA family protein [Rhizomicrobium electricum]